MHFALNAFCPKCRVRPLRRCHLNEQNWEYYFDMDNGGNVNKPLLFIKSW